MIPILMIPILMVPIRRRTGLLLTSRMMMRASPNFQRSLMTESIAPETAAKLAPAPKPAISTPLKTPDKPESVGKTESSTKISPSPEAPKPAPGVLAPPSGGEIRSPRGLMGHKKQAAIVASAVFSLIAGIAGVRLMLPEPMIPNRPRLPLNRSPTTPNSQPDRRAIPRAPQTQQTRQPKTSRQLACHPYQAFHNPDSHNRMSYRLHRHQSNLLLTSSPSDS